MSPNLGKKEEQRRARGKEGEIRKEQSNHGGEIIKTKEWRLITSQHWWVLSYIDMNLYMPPTNKNK